MDTPAEAPGFQRARLWALAPILVLVAVVTAFASTGSTLLDLVGHAPPRGRPVRRPPRAVQAGRDHASR